MNKRRFSVTYCADILFECEEGAAPENVVSFIRERLETEQGFDGVFVFPRNEFVIVHDEMTTEKLFP